MNKFWIFIALLAAISLIGCTNNSDTPPPIPKKTLVITYKDLNGTWELYYVTRKINNNEPLRDPGADGATQTFNSADKTFTETNIDGKQDKQGTFRILGNDTIEYTFKKKNKNALNTDSTTKRVIVKLNDKQLVSRTIKVDKQGGATNSAEDIYYYRNKAAAGPNETFDIPEKDKKEIININLLLKYKWEFIYFWKSEQIRNQQPEITEGDTDKGSYYQFKIENGEYRYRIFGPSQKSKAAGNDRGVFRVVDDVIFLFPDIPIKDDDTPYLWLKSWGWKKGQPNSFIDYTKMRDKNNIWRIIEGKDYYVMKE